MLKSKQLKAEQRSRQNKLYSNVSLVILLMGTWDGMINSAGGTPGVLGCKFEPTLHMNTPWHVQKQ